jgi:hypothetical protein
MCKELPFTRLEMTQTSLDKIVFPTYLKLTNFMQQNPRKNPGPYSEKNEPSPLPILHNFFKISHFMLISSKLSLNFSFPDENITRISLLSHACHMPGQPHPLCCDHPNKNRSIFLLWNFSTPGYPLYPRPKHFSIFPHTNVIYCL